MARKRSKRLEQARAMAEGPRLDRIMEQHYRQAEMAYGKSRRVRYDSIIKKRMPDLLSGNGVVWKQGKNGLWDLDEDWLFSDDDSWGDGGTPDGSYGFKTNGDLIYSYGFQPLPYCYSEKKQAFAHECIYMAMSDLGLTPEETAVCDGLLCAAASGLGQVTFGQLAQHLYDPTRAIAGKTVSEKAAFISSVAPSLCRKLKDSKFTEPEEDGIVGPAPSSGGCLIFKRIACKAEDNAEDGLIECELCDKAARFIMSVSNDFINSPL